LAEEIENHNDSDHWNQLADSLFVEYTKEFGKDLKKEYGSFSVLWPCRLYDLKNEYADQFYSIGPQKTSDWRYFPLAKAHQGFLAGNRNSAYETIENHLKFEQMEGWYLLDEGGSSGIGNWNEIRTNWKPDIAMPHGWSIAEFWLLLRDSFLFEDKDRLILMAGLPVDWFTDGKIVEVNNLPTHYGKLSFRYKSDSNSAILNISGDVSPNNGFILRMPKSLAAKVYVNGTLVENNESIYNDNEFFFSKDERDIKIEFD